MKKYIAALMLLVLISPSHLICIKDEYFRKTALLKAFAEYIKWPEESSTNDQLNPFIITVIGKNPFGSILEAAYHKEKRKIKDKIVEIRYIAKPDEIRNCHILFISKSVDKELEEILAITRGKPILTSVSPLVKSTGDEQVRQQVRVGNSELLSLTRL